MLSFPTPGGRFSVRTVAVLLHCGRLLTHRMEHDNFWSLPGGRVEFGEASAAALARELHEELGITIGPGVPWQVEIVDYPHALVRLHFCKVHDWRGGFEMREGQRMAWCSLPVHVQPVLPGTVPVLRWFAAERGHVGPTHSLDC